MTMKERLGASLVSSHSFDHIWQEEKNRRRNCWCETESISYSRANLRAEREATDDKYLFSPHSEISDLI